MAINGYASLYNISTVFHETTDKATPTCFDRMRGAFVPSLLLPACFY